MFSVSVKGVFRDPEGNVVLLMNERDEWELPGGRIEIGETPPQCLAREVREELNLTVAVGELIDSHLFEVAPGKHVFIITYACSLDGLFHPSLSHEHKSVGLFHPDALPSNLPIGYRWSIAAWQRRGQV
ncbi:MAG: NUDIX domain-containing protein [Duganella sp.]